MNMQISKKAAPIVQVKDRNGRLLFIPLSSVGPIHPEWSFFGLDGSVLELPVRLLQLSLPHHTKLVTLEGKEALRFLRIYRQQVNIVGEDGEDDVVTVWGEPPTEPPAQLECKKEAVQAGQCAEGATDSSTAEAGKSEEEKRKGERLSVPDGALRTLQGSKARIEYSRFGEMLRALRKKKGMSQECLGHKLGINPSLISYWERSKNMPADGKIRMIIKLLDLKSEEIIEFFHLAQSEKREFRFRGAGRSVEELEFVEAIHSLWREGELTQKAVVECLPSLRPGDTSS